MKIFTQTCWISMILLMIAGSALGAYTIGGDEENPATLMKWHKVEITFDGPSMSESNAATFSDHRLDVEFERPDGTKFWVAGFFAAAGNEADTGNGSGNKWRVRLNPDRKGRWSFTARFRTGNWVAVAPMSHPGGTGATAPDGETGTFTVGASDKDPLGRDFRGKGQLRYVKRHYCRFAESGEYFIRIGADSPEDFIADNEIDNTPEDGHDYAIHRTNHYSTADASAYTWKRGKGTGILGAIRYMGELQEMNNFYVIMITAPKGDAKDVFPWISTDAADRGKYDVSKLEQWERVFSYGDKKGIHWNLVFTESENDDMICGSLNLCDLERLYYREIIARFAHHHAIAWNVGEEHGGNDDGADSQIGQRIVLMNDLDPYSHTYTCHTKNNRVWRRYDQLFGIANSTSNQQKSANYNDNGPSDKSGVHAITRILRNHSAAAGLPMVVYIDEANGPVPRPGNDLDAVRKGTLWANLMAGGAGVEWYLGYDATSGWHDHNRLEDFTKMECLWEDSRYALRFFMACHDPLRKRKPVPFQNMQPDDGRASGTYNWCLYGADDDGKMCVVVYLRDGGSTTVNVPGALLYNVGWMNTRTGIWQVQEDIVNHTGGSITFTAPDTNDWALLIYDWKTDPKRNYPPNVYTGNDQTIMLPRNGKEVTVSLTGSVVDDGKSGRPVTSTWSAGNGPGKVRFAEANKLQTNVTLTGASDYVLTLTASDGKLTASDTVKITVEPFSPRVTKTYNALTDAFIEDSIAEATQELKVEHNRRVSYLKFKVTGLPASASILRATLRLTENGDTGSGTLRFAGAANNDWSANTLTASRVPANKKPAASWTGSVNARESIEVDVWLSRANGTAMTSDLSH